MFKNDDLARAYDVILQRAKQELEQLHLEVRAKETFISELTKQRQSDSARKAAVRVKSANGNGGAESSGGTWADRIDHILSAKPGSKFSPREIANALGAVNDKFEGMRVSASTLVRATTRRAGDKYGWKWKKKGWNVVWWKEGP